MNLSVLTGLFQVIVVALVGLLLLDSLRPTSRQLGLFSRLYSVPLTDATIEPLRGAIRRTRLFRYGGALLALLLGALLGVKGMTLPFVTGGYAVGAMAAETSRRPLAGTRRAASMEVRRPADYVKKWLVYGSSACAVMAGATCAVAVVDAVRDRQVPADGMARDLNGRGVILAAIGVALSFAGPVLAVVLARRPQPVAVSSDVAALQHSLRTVAMLSCLGGAMMTAGVVILATLTTATVHDIPLIQAALTMVGLVAGFVGLKMVIATIPRFSPFWARATEVAA